MRGKRCIGSNVLGGLLGTMETWKLEDLREDDTVLDAAGKTALEVRIKKELYYGENRKVHSKFTHVGQV